MLLLPFQEDSLLVRLCLYYGALVLLLELFMPLVFQRRVRIEIPRLPLRPPTVTMSTREFQQRRRALRQQIAALQRDLAETLRRPPQHRWLSFSANAKQKSIATSSTKVSRSKSSRKTSEMKQKNRSNRVQNKNIDGRRRREEAYRTTTARDLPMAVSETLTTRSLSHGSFSSYKVNMELKNENRGEENEDWAKTFNTRIGLRQESLFVRPVQLVENVEREDYSEATTSLNALIKARTRQTESNLLLSEPPSATGSNDSSAPAEVTVASGPSREKLLKHFVSQLPQPKRQAAPVSVGQQDIQKSDDERNQRKDSERREISDFQVFCASFAKGGSVAAHNTTFKRRHSQTIDWNNGVSNKGTGTTQQSIKISRLREYNFEQPNASAVKTALQSPNKRSYDEAFGSMDKTELDEALALQQCSEKRNHDDAFGMPTEQEILQKSICRTPQIVRRIAFDDEVNALAASASTKMLSECTSGKRKHKQAFGMVDDVEDGPKQQHHAPML